MVVDINVLVICVLSLLHSSVSFLWDLIAQDTSTGLGMKNSADAMLTRNFRAIGSCHNSQSSIGLELSIPTFCTVPVGLSIVYLHVSLVEAIAQMLKNLLLLCSCQILAFIDVVFSTHRGEAVQNIEHRIFNVYLTVAAVRIISDGWLFTEDIPESWSWPWASVHRHRVVVDDLSSLLVYGRIDTGVGTGK